ncbi:MAG: LysM peptidoglycan-binding domain-containing protein [Eubacterium sp.]|nr:LysM peptidoglycan-binding domain-containing protein [Eubacterium sp.]
MENTMIYDDAYGISERAAVRKRRRNHHRHIVNRIRFTILLVAAILMITMAGGMMIGSYNAEGSSKTSYEMITVQYGDTLWEIAECYKPADKDIRDFMYEICDYNNISAGEIFQGQNLMIPVSQ